MINDLVFMTNYDFNSLSIINVSVPSNLLEIDYLAPELKEVVKDILVSRDFD